MHAHDRTMLASLGFADPDKRDYRHDLACQYLASKEVAERLVPLLIREDIAQRIGRVYTKEGYKTKTAGRVVNVGRKVREGRLEIHIGKGEGQYKTTIGFLDVVIPFDLADKWTGYTPKLVSKEVIREGEHLKWPGGLGGKPEKQKYTWKTTEDIWEEEPASGLQEFDGNCIAIEVKTSCNDVGSILRQINLYRQYFRPEGEQLFVWAVATIAPLAPLAVATLKNADIRHVQLGQAFEDWMVVQASRADAGNVNPESIQL